MSRLDERLGIMLGTFVQWNPNRQATQMFHFAPLRCAVFSGESKDVTGSPPAQNVSWRENYSLDVWPFGQAGGVRRRSASNHGVGIGDIGFWLGVWLWLFLLGKQAGGDGKRCRRDQKMVLGLLGFISIALVFWIIVSGPLFLVISRRWLTCPPADQGQLSGR